MTGLLVPWHATPLRGNQSAKLGWITDANGCDIWQGSGAKGYGKAWVDGRMCYVHRVRYEREVGSIPEGTELDHFFCDNGAGGCCNPFHCRPVAQRENALRSSCQSAINAAKTNCIKGHPLSGENLIKSNLARGQRNCRICQNARRRAHRTEHARAAKAVA